MLRYHNIRLEATFKRFLFSKRSDFVVYTPSGLKDLGGHVRAFFGVWLFRDSFSHYFLLIFFGLLSTF